MNKIKWLVFGLVFYGFLSVVYADPVVQTYLYDQTPNPASSGDVVELKLNFDNYGTSSSGEVWVEFVEKYPFKLVEGSSVRQVISLLPNYPGSGYSKTLEYELVVDDGVSDGEYNALFRYSADQGANWVSHNYVVDVVSEVLVDITSISATKLLPGKETNVTFTLNNVGSTTLNDLTFYWTEAEGVILPVGADNTRYISQLRAGESVDITFTMIASVSATPDLYKLELNLEYSSRGLSGNWTSRTTTTIAGMFVGGETDFDVAFSESSEGQTSLSIANIGSTSALSVSVIIPQQDGYRVSGSTNSIVGNLDSGDYTIVSFQIVSLGGFNSEDLLVRIQYTDTSGTRQVVDKYVPIQFRDITSLTNATVSSSFPSGVQGMRNFYRADPLYTVVQALPPLILFACLAGGVVYYYKRDRINPVVRKLLKRKK